MVQKINAPLGGGGIARPSPRVPHLIGETTAALTEWLHTHERARLSWSGGKDSTVALWLTRQVRPDIPVCFFDSGLEFPQTLRYIERLAEQWDLNLHIYPAEPDILTLMEQNGSWDRYRVSIPKEMGQKVLIEEPSAKANADHGTSVIYGLRADESRARTVLLAKTRGVVRRHSPTGDVVEEHFAPLWRWTTRELMNCVATHRIPLNPLYQQMADLGIPERRRRVGTLITADMLEAGRWVHARMLAPDLCRRVEARLPALAEFR